MQLKVKKLTKDSLLPTYAKGGDAGMDLYANETVAVEPGKVGRIKTGISMEIPEGYVGLCWDKSGLSMNHGIKVLAGVIDSGFRGELVLGIINLSDKAYTFEKGHKVMQMLIQKVEQVDIVEADSLPDSERGKEGFGSTGK
jgi:dUTP pyrophosphatase